MLLGDYHTHTRFSHGKGKIFQTAEEADAKGLLQVGITDHGLRHIAFGMKTNDIFRMRNEIRQIQPKCKAKILLGVEANIFSSDGLIDLRRVDRGYFDYVVAGYHKGVWSKSIKDFFKFYIKTLKAGYMQPSLKEIQMFTNCYIQAIKTQKIDVISHLNYGIPVDVRQVGRAASDYGVLIELNGKRINLTDEEVLCLQDLGVHFIINSDAHSPSRVGDFELPLALVKRLSLKTDRIANWDKLPEFAKRQGCL